jgi:hypothetical protein
MVETLLHSARATSQHLPAGLPVHSEHHVMHINITLLIIRKHRPI